MDGLYESTAAESEGVDGAKMAHKEWEAIVKNGRKVSPGKGDQGTKPSRVCRHDEGKAGREGRRQAICAAAIQDR